MFKIFNRFNKNAIINICLFNTGIFLLYFVRQRKQIQNKQDNQSSIILYENKYKKKYNKLKKLCIEILDETIYENKKSDDDSDDSYHNVGIDIDTRMFKDCDKKQTVTKESNVIIENTPRGNVLLYFDFNEKIFNYYCDRKDIPYQYLETVARKYVVQYNCLDIFVNMADELKIDDGQQKQDKGSGGHLDKVVQKTPFARYKNYNKTNSRGNKNDTKKYILKENSNRYSYCGKISDFMFLKDKYYKKKQLTFADFKKR